MCATLHEATGDGYTSTESSADAMRGVMYRYDTAHRISDLTSHVLTSAMSVANAGPMC